MDFGTNKSTGFRVAAYIVLSLLAFVCIVPLLNIIMISISDSGTIKDFGYSLFPKKIDFGAYKLLMAKPDSLLNAYKVTIFVTFSGTLISVKITERTAQVRLLRFNSMTS